MKVAVVGLGYFGVNYVRIANDLPDAELVAVCDVFKANVDKVCAKYPHLTGFNDIDELLAMDGLEAIILITPATTHYETAKKVLKAKKASSHREAFHNRIKAGRGTDGACEEYGCDFVGWAHILVQHRRADYQEDHGVDGLWGLVVHVCHSHQFGSFSR